MNWSLFQQVGFFIFLILSIYFTARKEFEKLLALYFWSITFNCCFIFAVTIWLPSKVVGIAMGVCVLCNKPVRESNYLIESLLRLIIGALIISDIIYFVSDKIYNLQFNSFSRLIMGNISYIISIFSLMFYKLLSPGFVQRLYPKYCLAVEVAIIVGMVHFIFNMIGIPFMPILRVNDFNESGSVLTEFGGQVVRRVYGFCGEPKNLGFFIAPYLVSTILMYFNGFYRRNKKYHIIMMIFGAFVLYNTFSSSALIEFIIATPIALYYSKGKSLSSIFFTILVIVVLVVSFSIVTSNGDDGFLASMYERTFQRGAQELEEGRQETFIWEAYKQSPIYNLLFGWGAYQHTFHALGQLYESGGMSSLQSGLIGNIADFGLLGMIILLLCYRNDIKTLKLSLSCNDGMPLVFSVIATCVLVGHMMYGAFSQSLLFMSIAICAVADDEYNISDNI